MGKYIILVAINKSPFQGNIVGNKTGGPKLYTGLQCPMVVEAREGRRDERRGAEGVGETGGEQKERALI